MRPHPILLIIAALVFLSSDRDARAGNPTYSVDLFNNTEVRIDLIPRKGSAVEVYPGRHQIWPYAGAIVIRTENALLHFDPIEVPAPFVRKGLLSKMIRAQFSSDNKIWLVPLSTNWPMLHPVQQPPGFPLRPR